MKVKFIGKAILTSKGTQYVPGEKYEVKEDFYTKFSSLFEKIIEPKPATKSKPRARQKPKSEE